MTKVGTPLSECLWRIDEKIFSVAIVGTGPGFGSIVEIVSNEQYGEFLPDMEIVAIAEPDYNASTVERLREKGVKIYPTCEEMLAAHPGIDLLVELAGKRFRLKKIRDSLGSSISFMDHTAAIFLCGLHNMLQSKAYCQRDLARHKALLEAIIDEVRDDIILLDREGRIVDMNRNVRQRIGQDRDSLIGLPCCDVQALADGTPFCHGQDEKCPFFAAKATGETSEALFTRVDQEGRLLYFRVYAYPIFNESGGLTHIVIMRRDITRRTYLEKHQQHAEKLSIIGEISTYLAHEIRNPLCAIGGFSNSLLRSGNLDEKQREKIRIIADETKRLDSMLSSILNFARPAGTVMGTANLNRVVKETVELMKIGYSKQGHKFRVSRSSKLPKVVGEPEMIKQCLVNLIKNSLEAMPGGGEISIRTGLEKDFVVLEVEDTGKGMSDEELQKASSPFYTTKQGGYGLGLAMIRKIIEEFGGRVELTSKEGVGTKATIFFAPVLAVEEKKKDKKSLQKDN